MVTVLRKTCDVGKLGVLADMVELDEVGVTFKTIEALRGPFFFSTRMKLNTKGAGGGGAGSEMIDSNTSLPSILPPKHFFCVSAICFDRSDLTCTCFSGRFLLQSCGRATCITTFVTRETICVEMKLNVLLQGGGEDCFRIEEYETCFWTTCCLKASSL